MQRSDHPDAEGGIELIRDGEGLAVIGDQTAVDLFLSEHGLDSVELGLPRLRTVLGRGSAAAQAASEVAENAGRWVKLTKESAEKIDKLGLRASNDTGLSTGVLKGPHGQIKGFVQFTRAPRSALTNPALLSGAAGLMAQLAMQQAIDDITSYLAVIDEKVDDVLRGQKDEALARVIGVGHAIDEAMIVRAHRGRVDEIIWSKVQGASQEIGRAQGHALRRLDSLAEGLERKGKIGDLAGAAEKARREVGDWLAVLARCFQLQAALDVLELDRVMETAPSELDGHRTGLQAARRKRLESVARSTESVKDRLDAVAVRANTKVLFHPHKSPSVIASINAVGAAVQDFQERLGIEHDRQSWDARRWTEAATEVRGRAVATGAERVGAATRLGKDATGRALTAGRKLSQSVAGRATGREADTTASEDDGASTPEEPAQG